MPRSTKEGGRSSNADAPSPSSEISPPPPLISPVPSTPALLESPPAPSPTSASRSSPPPLSDAAAPASAPSPDSTPTSTLTGRSPPPPPSSRKTGSPPSPPSLPSDSIPPPPPPLTSPPPPRTAQSPPSPSTFTSPPPPLAAKPSLSSSNPPQSPPSFFSSSTISGASLVGIGLAGTLAFTVLCVLFYCLCRKKKRYHQGDYYNQHGGQPYKDPYYGVDIRHNQEWCSPSSESHMKALPTNGALSTRSGYDPIPPSPKGTSASGLGNSKAWFMYHDLANATNGFSKANALGEGGFGCVYKGTLPSGQLIAVKQLKSGASQGEKEFRAEVEIISRVHHRHLVSLVGYCIADRQRLLVYDYVPNGTLEYHLHRKDGPIMDWPTRLKIACGAARGLAYLHEDCHPRIIHRDIKSSNILLDDNFEAQVSDFGLAKLTSDTNTHVTTRVMGTFGYLAPEYASSGKLTDRSDVFSFGVVLLELLTGRKPVDPLQPAGEESLVEWARPILAQVSSDEDLRAVADPAMEGNFDSREVMRMLEAAAACVRHSANKRPRMGQVLRALEDDGSLSDLNKGSKPGQSGVFGSFTSMDYENGSYSADMRKYMRVALDSTQEFGSEGSAATSEYGLNASMSSSEFHMSKDMGDRSTGLITRHLKPTSASATVSGEYNMSMEMRDQSTSLQQQRPKQPLSMRTNMLTYNTQEFRLGS